MSTDLHALETELNEMITSGKALEGFDRFYADDVVMQEGLGDKREGKQANRAYEEQFFASVAEIHQLEVHAAASHGDRSFSEWTYDITFKDGNRMSFTQVAARTWRDGKIVYERFYSAGS